MSAKWMMVLAVSVSWGCLPANGGGGGSNDGGSGGDGQIVDGGQGGAGADLGAGGGVVVVGGAGGSGGGAGGSGGGAVGGAGGGLGGAGGVGGVGGVGGGEDCTPERCDGLDNDCDGEIDDGFEGLGDGCVAGVGECETSGTIICAPDGDGVVCDALTDRAVAEICDGLDNDCDGIVDNGFPLGEVCFDGDAGCRVQGETVCGPDGQVRCNAVAGAGGEEVCNGLDDDCDGNVDEGLGLGERCTVGFGICQADGVRICGIELQVICDAEPGEPVDEICDGLDNNCDGLVDNDCAGDAVALPANEGFGHHGSCDSWNECGDAEGCADAACALEGFGEAVSWEEAVCGPEFVCRIFRNLPNDVEEGWHPWGDCHLPIATAVVCAAGEVQAEEICGDGLDNDENGLTDCADPTCAATPECRDVNGQVGAFNVGDGPQWLGALSQSCVAVCADLFGGPVADYGCSTVNGAYNGRAHVDGYGDNQYCEGADVAEDYVLPQEGARYDCAVQGCSYSAYVTDHGVCETATNYCWRVR